MPLLGQAYVDITGDLTGLKTSLVTARQEVQKGLEAIETQQVEVMRRGQERILDSTRRFASELRSILKVAFITYFASILMESIGAFARAVRENTDEANEAFEKSIPIIGRLSTAITGMVSEIAGWSKATRDMNESNKKLDETFKQINKDLELRRKLLREIAVLRATPAEAARLKVEYKYEDILAPTPGIERAVSTLKALELAKLTAEEYKKAKEPIIKITEALREQTENFGKSEYEINRYKLIMAGASEVNLYAYDKLALVAKIQDAAKKKWEESREAVRLYREEIAAFAKRVWTETRTPLENLKALLEKLDETFLGGGKEAIETYRRKLKAMREELKGQLPEQRLRIGFVSPSQMWQQMTMQISDIPKKQLNTQLEIKKQLELVNTKLEKLNLSPVGE